MKLFLFIILFLGLSSCLKKDESISVISTTESTDAECKLSLFADSILYYPLFDSQPRYSNIQLTDKYILAVYSSVGKLYDRKTGTILKEFDLGSPLNQPSYWWGNFVSKNYIASNGKEVYIRKRLEKRGKVFFELLKKNLGDGAIIDSISLPHFYSFPLTTTMLWGYKQNIKNEKTSVTLEWYNSQHQLVNSFVQPDSFPASQQNKLLHFLNDEIYYHANGSSIIYKLDKEGDVFPFVRFNECYIKDLYISLPLLWGTCDLQEASYRIVTDMKSVWKIPIKDARKNTYEGVINDIDGGLDFWPQNVSNTGEIYTWYQVDEMKRKIQQKNTTNQKIMEMLDRLPQNVKTIVVALKKNSK